MRSCRNWKPRWADPRLIPAGCKACRYSMHSLAGVALAPAALLCLRRAARDKVWYIAVRAWGYPALRC